MLVAVVQGSVTATMKHPSMQKVKLLIVQPYDPVTGKPQGLAQIAADVLGAGLGSQVLLSNDGRGAQEMLGAGKDCPVRLAIMALLDPITHGEVRGR